MLCFFLIKSIFFLKTVKSIHRENTHLINSQSCVLLGSTPPHPARMNAASNPEHRLAPLSVPRPCTAPNPAVLSRGLSASSSLAPFLSSAARLLVERGQGRGDHGSACRHRPLPAERCRWGWGQRPHQPPSALLPRTGSHLFPPWGIFPKVSWGAAEPAMLQVHPSLRTQQRGLKH